MSGRSLGLDVGDKRIGIALSDPSGLLASGHSTLHRTHLDADVSELISLVESESVSTIVVGWPLETNGRVGRQARRVETLTDALSAATEVPIIFWDERFTTVQAERILIQGGVRRQGRKAVIDKVAATIILQSWLDSPRTPVAY